MVGDSINNSESYSLNASGLNDTAFGDAFAKGLKNETGVFDALYGDFNYDFSKTTNTIQSDNHNDPFYEPTAYESIEFEPSKGIKSLLFLPSMKITISSL